MTDTVHTSSASMDSETLEALRGSIAKWEGIVAGTVRNEGTANCPLCRKFHTDYTNDYANPCGGCPVFERTGVDGCTDTPYDDYSQAFRAGDYAAMSVAAQAELNFLKSLLPIDAPSDDEQLTSENNNGR